MTNQSKTTTTVRRLLPEALKPFMRRLRYWFRWAKDRLSGIPEVSSGIITSEIIRACIRSNNPVVVEIGCNDGTNTLAFAESLPNAAIYCFEPDPRCIARFVAQVGDRPNITLFKAAVSDRDGKAEFFQSSGQHPEGHGPEMPDGWDLSGSIRRPKWHLAAHPWVTFDRPIEVPTITLDTWCDTNAVTDIDFLWMDVQGAELDVFRGARRVLARTRYIYTEYNNAELYEGQGDLRKIMRQLPSFRIVVRFAGDVLLYNTEITAPPDELLIAAVHRAQQTY
jgi:2-O-methyltransferase